MESQTEYTTKNMTIKDLIALNAENKLELGTYYQRPEQAAWKKPERTDMLLDSILRGWHIQPLHVRETTTGKVEMLDGKQRTTAIFRIFSDIAKIELENGIAGEDIAGKSFSMFPETWREKFLNYPLEMVYHAGLDDDQIVDYFGRLQKGIPLNAAQCLRGDFIKRLQATGIIALLEKIDPCPAKERMNYETIALQLFESHNPTPSWKGKEYINRFIKSPDVSKIAEKIKIQLANLEKIITVGKTDPEYKKALKRMLKKVHVPSIVINLSTEEVNEDQINDYWNRLAKFYEMERDDKTEQRKTYDTASTADSASESNIKIRIDTIRQVLTAPLVIKDTNPPAPQTDATEEKLNADKAFIEDQKAKAQKALNAKIEAAKKAKEQALQDIKEDEDADEDEQPKQSKFMQRKAKEQQRKHK
jgi:hypothetical protein